MKSSLQSKLLAWFPKLNPQVWILAMGRFLSEVGAGFTLFYAPIFFAKGVGLSATEVGLGLGSASISGVFGRIIGGSFSDSQFWGRRRTLLLSAAISTIASFALAATNNFFTFLLANLLAGFGIGLYWPATEAAVADLTEGQVRQEAYAVVRLADNLGLGLGIILGGILISATGNYRTLFIIDGISFIVFFAVVYLVIAETYKGNDKAWATTSRNRGFLPNSWQTALNDRLLLVFVVVNIIFTTYISQLHSTIGLYFSGKFSSPSISLLFSWHMVLAILTMIPVSRILKRFNHPEALMISALFWGIGFGFVWFIGGIPELQLIWAILAMAILAIATVSYTPSASAFVADIAPASLRGVYLSINSLCWAVGYAIGPPLGGWAMDQNVLFTNNFWLVLSFSVIGLIAILRYLNYIFRRYIILGNRRDAEDTERR
ncbi:MFS transporter [Phormidium sp. LEGE 05292]|uniref:MFS transporter n=1 Tax=[Phormidium] sp. LEGE 05292 TaxID=767427 RepID=UPI0018805203|nr:MFS transporter [Phormidium sp. LEGE 05292]MBE9226999.1 MFS transporter [Phormidium sp. LEGE 05292]